MVKVQTNTFQEHNIHCIKITVIILCFKVFSESYDHANCSREQSVYSASLSRTYHKMISFKKWLWSYSRSMSTTLLFIVKIKLRRQFFFEIFLHFNIYLFYFISYLKYIYIYSFIYLYSLILVYWKQIIFGVLKV